MFFLFIILCAIIQVSLSDSIQLFWIRPDLLFIALVIAGITFKARAAVTFGIVCGILKDAFGIGAFGMNSVLFPLWSVAIITLTRRISLEYNIYAVIFVALFACVNAITTRVLFAFFGMPVPVWAFLRIAFFESLYTALFFPVVLKVAKDFVIRKKYAF